MPEPGRQQLRTVTVKKATKSGAVDKRTKGPLRTEIQTKTAADQVVKKGKEKATRTVAANLGIDTDVRKQQSAREDAMRDIRAEEARRPSTMTRADLAEQQSRRKSDKVFAHDKPPRNATPAETAQLIRNQNKFDTLKPGPRKEEARRAIGRSIQLVHPGHAVEKTACQTPGCNNNATDDVICTNCQGGGDLAGKTYKDAPEKLY